MPLTCSADRRWGVMVFIAAMVWMSVSLSQARSETPGLQNVEAPGTVAEKTLVGAGVDPAGLNIRSNTDRQTFKPDGDGLLVTVVPGKKATPTLFISPREGAWDLSAFGHIVATITNLDDKQPLRIEMRVENKGDWRNKPWNVEVLRVLPGKTQQLKVLFGHHYGYNPGFKLDPSAVTQVALYFEHPEETRSYRIESIVAGGEPGEKPQIKPEQVRIVPEAGVILGKGTDIGQTLALSATDGRAAVVDGGVQLTFAAGAGEKRALLRPKVGRWNLRDHLEVKVTLTNIGQAPVTPSVRLESNSGNSDTISVEAPLAVGRTQTITVPFMTANIWQGPQVFDTKPYKGTGGTKFASNVVSAVVVTAQPGDSAQSLRVDGIVAGMPERQSLPDWLGKRPPVEGDWSMTFEENFDSEVDAGTWNIYTANFWDKRSHFSKNNVIIGDGVVRLRFERKTGHHNDDPQGKVTDYATGFLDTYGKWTQLYGYFEARMKLPTAPGLWPAFWLMPDRGEQAGPQWKRADTGNGGMEFDIMEYLSRWGPNRFSPAFHWDGYGKNHKATGTNVYFAPDEQGFVTSGLLWLPGMMVIYCNGVEVARWETPRISNVQSYIKFTAVSGGWDNDPLDDTKLPDDFVIDYVRVWQRTDLKAEAQTVQTKP